MAEYRSANDICDGRGGRAAGARHREGLRTKRFLGRADFEVFSKNRVRRLPTFRSPSTSTVGAARMPPSSSTCRRRSPGRNSANGNLSRHHRLVPNHCEIASLTREPECVRNESGPSDGAKWVTFSPQPQIQPDPLLSRSPSDAKMPLPVDSGQYS